MNQTWQIKEDCQVFFCARISPMDDHPSAVSPSLRNHKRQLAWQILVPFLLVTALIIAGAILVVAGGQSQTRLWADVSIIWLIAPMLLFALLLAVMLGFLIFGMLRLIQATPRLTTRIQGWMATVSSITRKAADGAATPVVWVHQAQAAARAFINKFK
jgi:hypothetical protein